MTALTNEKTLFAVPLIGLNCPIFFLLTLFYIGKEILSHTSKIKIDYLHQ